MLVGYARVSSVGQSLELQSEALSEAGCEKVFAEKRSGSSTTQRSELLAVLDFVREGDTLVVTRLDRLARSVADLFKIIEQLAAKQVAFRCLQQSGVDTEQQHRQVHSRHPRSRCSIRDGHPARASTRRHQACQGGWCL